MSLSSYEKSVEERIRQNIQTWEKSLLVISPDQQLLFQSIPLLKDSDICRSNSGKAHKSVSHITLREPRAFPNQRKVVDIVSNFGKQFPAISPAMEMVVADTLSEVLKLIFLILQDSTSFPFLYPPHWKWVLVWRRENSLFAVVNPLSSLPQRGWRGWRVFSCPFRQMSSQRSCRTAFSRSLAWNKIISGRVFFRQGSSLFILPDCNLLQSWSVVIQLNPSRLHPIRNVSAFQNGSRFDACILLGRLSNVWRSFLPRRRRRVIVIVIMTLAFWMWRMECGKWEFLEEIKRRDCFV